MNTALFAKWLPAATLALTLGLLPTTQLQAQNTPTLTVASFGGQLDEVYKEVFREFEQQNQVRIQWVPGTAPGNVAKITATRNAPEYDLLLSDNINQRIASNDGLLAPINPAIVSNWSALIPQGQAKGQDGAAIGLFITGLYYRTDEFAKRGWAAPTSWNDLFRPEFCGHLGLERASQVYTLNAVILLADADTRNINRGISRFAELSKCARVLEPAAAKHEEKILLGETLIGVNATIRALPLTRRLELAFVLPEEGAVISSTMVSPVKNSPNPELAQQFINWFLSPQAQAVLVQKLFYAPVHQAVSIPEDLKALGIPDAETLGRLPDIDLDDVVNNRRDWSRLLERAVSR